MHPGGPSPEGRVDVRLVPSALTCWAVTAGGIWWPIGRELAWCCAVAGAAARRPPHGAGFGFAVALRADAVDHHPIAADFGASAPVTVTPSESPVSLGSGNQGRLMFRATLQQLRSDQMSGRVVVFARGPDFGGLMVGQPVRFTARIGRPTRRDLTVAVLTASGRPTLGSASAVQRAAHEVRRRFAAADQAALLLVLGDTSAVPTPTGRDFRAAGMTHLMAVSGANVTIVCAAVLFSARLIGPRAAVLLAALALVAFVVVVQPTASVLRAAVMGAIALAGMLTSRRRQAIPALAATVLVLLAVAPQLSVDVGFALSVLATAALVVLAPAWSRRLADRGCRAFGRGHLRPVQRGRRRRKSAGGGRDRTDHGAGHRGGGTVPDLAGRRAAADPFHRPRVVVGGRGGPPGATVPVPDGTAGTLIVGGVTLLAVVAWRWRRFRAAAAALLVGLAWVLSGLA